MDPFQYGKALADLWAAGGDAMLKAQNAAAQAASQAVMQAMQQGAAAMTGGAGITPGQGMPDFSAMLGGDAGLTRATAAMSELFNAASGLSATLLSRLPGQAADAAAGQGGEDSVNTMFRRMVSPQTWLSGAGELQDVLSRAAEGPRFADLWEVERKYARVFSAWTGLRQRSLEHNAVVLEAWVEAGRQFADGTKPAADALSPPDARALLAKWTAIANKVLLANQRSEPFLRTQTALIRASTELRLAQRDLVEHYGDQYGFPTRTELDDVHRTVTELRREMRALRRAARAASVPAAVPPAEVAAPAVPALAAPAPDLAPSLERVPAPAASTPRRPARPRKKV